MTGLKSLNTRRSTMYFDTSTAAFDSDMESEYEYTPSLEGFAEGEEDPLPTQEQSLDALEELETHGSLRVEREKVAGESGAVLEIPHITHINQPDCLRSDVASKFGSNLNLTSSISNATFFVTGGTGYVGSVVVEQLLRLFPTVKKIYLLIRPKRGQPAEERLEALLTKKALFSSLLVDGKMPAELRSKVAAVAGDTTSEGLGLSKEDRDKLHEEVNFVVHSAASISFFEHIHVLLLQNYQATSKVIDLAKGCKHFRGFIHVSTAYVNSNLPRGSHIEEFVYPLKKRSGELLSHTQLAKLLGSLPPARAEKEAQALLKEVGLPNCYTLTKHWSEDLLADTHSAEFPVAIVRPSIVGSLAGAPLPGYFGNAAGLTSATLAFATGMARFTCHNPFSVYDVIPCDLVGYTILACCPVLDEPGVGGRPATVVHSCTSTSHPFSFAESMRRLILPYWSLAPPKHRLNSKPYKPFDARWVWVDYNSAAFKVLTAQADLRVAAVAMAVRMSGKKKTADLIQSSWTVWKLYNTPTMDFELFYCTRVLSQLQDALDPAEREALGLKLVWGKENNWWNYLMDWQVQIRTKYYSDTLEAAKGFVLDDSPATEEDKLREQALRERGPQKTSHILPFSGGGGGGMGSSGAKAPITPEKPEKTSSGRFRKLNPFRSSSKKLSGA